MKPALSRFDRMDMLREAGESSWLRSFLENFQGKHTAASLLPIAREGIFFYLRERYAMTMREQGYTREEAEKALRDVDFVRAFHAWKDRIAGVANAAFDAAFRKA